jgi:hypothetical protein
LSTLARRSCCVGRRDNFRKRQAPLGQEPKTSDGNNCGTGGTANLEMATAEDTNPRPAREFRAWAEKTRSNYIAHDLFEQQHTFLPFSELRAYWSPLQVSNVLRAYSRPLPFDGESIRSDYLRAFSTLVFTGNTRRFLGQILTSSLDDTKWPLDDYPKKWSSDDDDLRRAFESVQKAQWIFFPRPFNTSLLTNSKLDPCCILPIKSVETLGPYNKADIHKIEIYEEYNHVVSLMSRIY